ncbi:RNase H domain-containing protein [Trichonephila clavipes]|nr:RNase H domain-containing protein [Trichonephila clavipes]
MPYSGFEPEPTRLKAEGHIHRTGWAPLACYRLGSLQHRPRRALMKTQATQTELTFKARFLLPAYLTLSPRAHVPQLLPVNQYPPCQRPSSHRSKSAAARHRAAAASAGSGRHISKSQSAHNTLGSEDSDDECLCGMGGTLNCRRAASPLVWLVEEASKHPQGFLPLNWGVTEQKRTVACIVLKAKAIDRRKILALSRDEFRGPQPDFVRQVMEVDLSTKQQRLIRSTASRASIRRQKAVEEEIMVSFKPAPSPPKGNVELLGGYVISQESSIMLRTPCSAAVKPARRLLDVISSTC